MNARKKNGEFAGVRKKLTAAVAMLLVATIMMASSTYAWFTLSTAPEVTGITTSVGANGNLEMALLNSETFKDLQKITTSVGDSSKLVVADKNITWGNLTDLSTGYGLDKITLNPSRLLFTKDANTVNLTNMLGYAVYGEDGRVESIDGVAYAGADYDGETNTFKYNANAYGVRPIGSNDTMTAQQSGLITARTNYNAYLNNSYSVIQKAMATNGGKLSGMIVTLATSDAFTPDSDQIAALKALLTAARDALEQVDKAYIEVMKAALATAINEETAYTAAVGTLSEKQTAKEAFTALADLSKDAKTALADLETAINTLETNKASVATELTNVDSESPNYQDILKVLVDYNMCTLNGFHIKHTGEGTSCSNCLLTIDESGKKVISSDALNAIVNGGKGVVVEMPHDSGIFGYLAKVNKNYSAKIDHLEGTIQGINLAIFSGTLTTIGTPNTTITTLVTNMKAATVEGGAANSYLGTMYGYAIDLAFRTNASGSYLKLLTDGAQRIYSDGTNVETMGGGSTMTFMSGLDSNGNEILSENAVKKLMGCIRVVFINPDRGDIYGVAALTNITTEKVEAGNSYTGKLKLHKWTKNADGSLTVTAYEDAQATDKLMDLDQNAAKKMTAVVYLDGDLVDNTMVANAAQSLTGSLNLQFGSSAELKPMDYSPLKGNEIATEPTKNN